MKARSHQKPSNELATNIRPFADRSIPFPLALFTLDRGGRIIGANAAGVRLFGQSHGMLIGKLFISFVANDSIENYKAYLNTHIRQEHVSEHAPENLNLNLNLNLNTGRDISAGVSITRYGKRAGVRFLVALVDLAEL